MKRNFEMNTSDGVNPVVKQQMNKLYYKMHEFPAANTTKSLQ